MLADGVEDNAECVLATNASSARELESVMDIFDSCFLNGTSFSFIDPETEDPPSKDIDRPPMPDDDEVVRSRAACSFSKSAPLLRILKDKDIINLDSGPDFCNWKG